MSGNISMQDLLTTHNVANGRVRRGNMQEREEKIAEARSKQPLAELERKWEKARGRRSNAYWTAEWLDLARARGRVLYEKLRKRIS